MIWRVCRWRNTMVGREVEVVAVECDYQEALVIASMHDGAWVESVENASGGGR